jgi:uncharacterized membrane protein YbhN (UPF0104 family)
MFADHSLLVSGRHPGLTLAVRGRAIRIFGAQAVVLTVSLVLLGGYLIADEFKNPLSSQSVGLFVAAFILATAMTLLLELTQLFRRTRSKVANNPVLVQHPKVVASSGRHKFSMYGNLHPYLPYHRGYIDRVRVRA